MKSSTLCIVALLSFALAGQAWGQATVDSYRKAGAAYAKAGQDRESVQAYQQVIRLKPDDADAYQQLGEAYIRLGMTKEAADAYGKAASLFEKQADVLLSAQPAPAAAPSARPSAPKPQAPPPAAIGQHKVGERVDYVDNGVWSKAVIILVRDDAYSPYRIHPLGYNGLTDSWVCCLDFKDRRSQLNPAGSHPTEPVPGGEANDEVLKAMRGDPSAAFEPSPAYGYVARTTPAPSSTSPAVKQYDCAGTTPITITGNGTYRGGTYTFNASTSTLTFKGGDYDGQRATYEMSFGLAQLHILGPSGRPVIDCD